MGLSSSSNVTQINGIAVAGDELAPLAFAGFAHFTAMQVRDGKTRGLDLHLERLRSASAKLFGRVLADEKVKAFLRAALDSAPPDASLTATIYSPAGEFVPANATGEPAVLVRVGPAAVAPNGPLRLKSFEHERFMPEIKHVGEGAKTYYLQQAVNASFDDAVFRDREGRISEGSIWNLAFWDGREVVWPEAAKLNGITMQIVSRQLERLGVRQSTREITLADLPTMKGAALMNSWTPGIAVSRIDSIALPEALDFLARLHEAYAAETPVAP